MQDQDNRIEKPYKEIGERKRCEDQDQQEKHGVLKRIRQVRPVTLPRHAEDVKKTETETGQHDRGGNVLEINVRYVNQQSFVPLAVSINRAEEAVGNGYQRVVGPTKTPLLTLRDGLCVVA